MDTVSQLKADVIVVNQVTQQEEGDHHDEKYNDEKQSDATPPAESPSNGGDDSASIVRKLTSKQELIVFSACCISLFRKDLPDNLSRCRPDTDGHPWGSTCVTAEAGWNDASSGPLLPSLQAKYEIRYLLSQYISGRIAALFMSLKSILDRSEYHLSGTMRWVRAGGYVERVVDGPVRLGLGKSPP